MSVKSFLVDVDKCSGCGLCVVACKDEHVGSSYEPWTHPQPATDHFWMRLQSRESGSVPKVAVAHLPIMCQHCTNAPCIKACPENAIKRRDDGLVWIDPELCTGCGDCQTACPYDVIYMNEESSIAQKCTGCAHRVDEGLEPRCVDICPHEALTFGDSESRSMTAALADAEVFHPEYNTSPLVLWKALPARHVSGMVIDRTTNEVVPDADVTVTDLFYDESVTAATDEFGDFWVRSLATERNYLVKVSKPGYAPVQRVFEAKSTENLGEIELEPSAPSANE